MTENSGLENIIDAICVMLEFINTYGNQMYILIAYFAFVIVVLSTTMREILHSQSSEEVNMWVMSRRGEFKRRLKNQKKAEKKKKKIEQKQNFRKKKALHSQSAESSSWMPQFESIPWKDLSLRLVITKLRDWSKTVKNLPVNALASFRQLYNNFNTIRASMLWRSAQKLFSICVALGVITMKTFTYDDMALFTVEKQYKPVTVFDAIEAACEFANLFFERFLLFCDTHDIRAFYADAFADKIAYEYTFLVTNFIMLEAGKEPVERINIEDTDSETRLVSQQEYDRRLAEFETTLNLKIASCKDNEKSGYTAKLKEIKSIIGKREMSRKKSIRMRPFSFLLFGGSSVGKSTLITPIIRAILKMNGFDSSQRSVCTLNEVDKFQSEYRSYHTGVIFDDLCNMKTAALSCNPLEKVLSFINNIPQFALNPNAELKGVIGIEPKVCAGNTNVKDLNVDELTNEQIAILGRFCYTITQKVRPEYQKHSGMLDSDKIEHMEGLVFPDYALFTVETPYYEIPAADCKNKKSKKTPTQSIGYRAAEYKGQKMIDVDIVTLMNFLRDASRKHFAKQKKLVDTANSAEELVMCEEHDLPDIVCGCGKKACEEPTEEDLADLPPLVSGRDILDSQAAVSDLLNDLYDTILQTERAWFILLNQTLLNVLLTLPCVLTIIFLNSQEWTNHIVELYSLHYYSFGALLLWDFMTVLVDAYGDVPIIRVPMILYLLPAFFTLKSIWHSSKVFAAEKARNFATFRRPSELWLDTDARTRTKVLGGIVALVGVTTLRSFMGFMSTFATSEACETVKPQVPDGEKGPEEHPFWSSLGRAFKYKWDARPTHRSRTTSLTKDQEILKKRQWSIVIQKSATKTESCNAVPIKSNALLIPNHVVPKQASFVTIYRPDRIQTESLSREAVYHIPNTDYAIWYCPGVGDQKDLTDMFADILPQGKQLEFELLYHNKETKQVENFGKYSGLSGYTRTDKGGSFDSYSYYVEEGTFHGMCMATALAQTQQGFPFICGFHLAGKGTKGAIGAISRQQIVDGLKAIEQRPGHLLSHAETEIDKEICGIELGIHNPIDKDHPVALLPKDANLTVIGQHKLPVGQFNSSNVVTSLISEHVEPVSGIKKIHGKATGLNKIEHRNVDLDRKTHTANIFDQECFEKACIDYKSKLMNGLSKADLASLGKIDDDVNLAGLDGHKGINSIALDTSMGFPFRGQKKRYVSETDRRIDGISRALSAEQWIWDEVNRRESVLREGDRSNMIFKAAMKDESTKLDKEKRRVFAGCSCPDTLLVRRYFLSLSALMQKHKKLFECAVGVDVQSPEFSELMDYVSEHGTERIIAGDYKAFDGQMSRQFMLAVFRIAIDIMVESGNFDGEDLEVLKGIASEISSPTVDFFGVLVKFLGSNPSGHPLTVIINSIVNSLYIRYAYYVIAKEDRWWNVPIFHKVCNLITYGDDNEMGVKPGYDSFNHTRIAEVLARSGIVYTMADKEAESVPYIKLTEASFLKHYPVWNEELNLYTARIEEDSVAKMLHTHMKSTELTPQQHSCEALQNVARCWFGYGREYYTRRVPELYEIARRAGITGLLGDLKTYDERLIDYKRKYKIGDYAKSLEEETLESHAGSSIPPKYVAAYMSFIAFLRVRKEYDPKSSTGENIRRMLARLVKTCISIGVSFTIGLCFQLYKKGFFTWLANATSEEVMENMVRMIIRYLQMAESIHPGSEFFDNEERTSFDWRAFAGYWD